MSSFNGGHMWAAFSAGLLLAALIAHNWFSAASLAVATVSFFIGAEIAVQNELERWR